MNYTLRQLQVFLKVTETQSITKASEALYLTQPAVSIQLRKLQDQFDIPLTEVIGRQLQITPFGYEIAEMAGRILREVEGMEQKTLAYKGFLVGQLTIAVVSTGKYVMPYFLTHFLARHPGLDLRMDVTNKTTVVQALEENEVDFALVSVLPEHLRVEKETLMENKLFLVGNPHQYEAFHRRKPLQLTDLPFIYREPGSATRRAMEEFIHAQGWSVRKRMELTSNEAVKQAVIAGLGCSVMPLIGIKKELADGDLKIIPVKGLPVTTSWNLIWLQGKQFSPAAAAYLQHLRSSKHTVIGNRFRWMESYFNQASP